MTGRLITGETCVPEPMPSEPSVVPPADGTEPDEPVPDVEPELVPSPTTPIPLPEIVTGTDTRPPTCVPESSPSEPSVVGVGAPVPVPVPTGVVVVEPEAAPSPRTPIPLPETVTGTDTTGATCVPEAVPSAPDVVGAEADESAAGAAGAVAEDASPATPTALPDTVTGTSTSGAICVPEAVPSAPDVVGAGAGAGAGCRSRSRSGRRGRIACDPEALPDTVTGTLTAGATCVPEAVPSAPEVTGAGAAGAEDAGAAGAGVDAAPDPVAVDTASPRTPSALPVTDTGASTDGATCVPETAPSAPEVVAAFAAAAPPRVRPPTKRANQSPLETYLFMVVHSLIEIGSRPW